MCIDTAHGCTLPQSLALQWYSPWLCDHCIQPTGLHYPWLYTAHGDVTQPGTRLQLILVVCRKREGRHKSKQECSRSKWQRTRRARSERSKPMKHTSMMNLEHQTSTALPLQEQSKAVLLLHASHCPSLLLLPLSLPPLSLRASLTACLQGATVVAVTADTVCGSVSLNAAI